MSHQIITPFFWHDGQAAAAARFYAEVFSGHVIDEARYTEAGHDVHGQSDGEVMVAECDILGYRLIGLNGGPAFRPSPAISLFVQLPDRDEAERIWTALSDGGTALMPFDAYDWSPAYGWCNDRYSVSWQIMFDAEGTAAQPVTPMLAFTGAVTGRAAEALGFYASVFPGSAVEMTVPYPAGASEPAGSIVQGRAVLAGGRMIAMDAGRNHDFGFDEGVSLVVGCADQAEVDHYWDRLVEGGGSHGRCGWLKDRFGVSWQVVPKPVTDILAGPDRKAASRAMDAVMGMDKIDIATVLRASLGE